MGKGAVVVPPEGEEREKGALKKKKGVDGVMLGFCFFFFFPNIIIVYILSKRIKNDEYKLFENQEGQN